MTFTGFYSGSFDPVTNGHLDIIRRAARLCDRLVIGIGVHPSKNTLFTAEERTHLLQGVCQSLPVSLASRIDIIHYRSLTVDAAREAGANTLIRGLRDAGDFDYEMQMAGMNSHLHADMETLFLAASPDVRHIAARLVRQIASLGGATDAFVPPSVARALKNRFAGTGN